MDHIWKREKPSIRNGAHLPSKRVTFALQNGAHLLFKAVVPSTQGGPQVLKVGRRHPSRWAAGIPQGLPQVLMKVCRRHPSRWPTICHPARPRHFPPRLVPLGVPNPVAPKSAFEASSPNSTKSSSNSTRGTDPLRKRTIPAINKRPALGWRQPFVFLYLVLSWYQLIRNTNYHPHRTKYHLAPPPLCAESTQPGELRRPRVFL